VQLGQLPRPLAVGLAVVLAVDWMVVEANGMCEGVSKGVRHWHARVWGWSEMVAVM